MENKNDSFVNLGIEYFSYAGSLTMSVSIKLIKQDNVSLQPLTFIFG